MTLPTRPKNQQHLPLSVPSLVPAESVPRRKFLAGLVAGAGSIALSACGGGGSGDSPAAVANDASVANKAGSSGFTVTTPAANATISGTITVTGTAGTNWRNVAVYDHATVAKIGADTTPSSGKFSIQVDTTKLTVGSHQIDVVAFSVAAGQAGGTKTTQTITVNVTRATSPSTSGSLFYGMNGHLAWPDGIYHTMSAAAQLALLKDLGVTTYRVDVADAGMAQTVANALTGAFAGSGVSIMPCINVWSTAYNQNGSESAAYTLGYNLGSSIAKPLKGLVKYIECGNELDSNGLITNGDGSNTNNYSPAIWPAFRGVIRGMIDGVKAIDPTIQCGVNVGVPLAYRALQMLWSGITPNGSANGVSGAAQVRWDYTTYHWYQSSGDIICGWRNNACLNVLQVLKDSFNLPIWLTEWGWQGNQVTPAQQASYVTKALTEYRSLKDQYNIQSVQMYCLIDPDFGLIQADGVTKNPSYAAFKNFVAANPV
ncbi:Ig-like domain-containing protein [Paraburkholderia dipogonis]|uniref:Ig-like domain-containing protein n=1 Tax=Paraburkholderia dipogonis TaxID=1211383 RepID=A0ABW9AV54_9BURK